MTNPQDDYAMIPHMPEPAIEALEAHLKTAKCYLEYGSGGSTVLAASLGVPAIYAVDTSVEWFEKVKDGIQRTGYAGKIELLHVNIGKTKKWGYPVDDRQATRWPRYFLEPWKLLREANLSPDVILVDGRFRVSCFLVSLAHARLGTTLLFDDYVGRKHYHLVEEILKPINYYDRMAEFVKTSEPPASSLLEIMGMSLLDTR